MARNQFGGSVCGHCGSAKMTYVSSRKVNAYIERVVYKCLDCKNETPIDTDANP